MQAWPKCKTCFLPGYMSCICRACSEFFLSRPRCICPGFHTPKCDIEGLTWKSERRLCSKMIKADPYQSCHIPVDHPASEESLATFADGGAIVDSGRFLTTHTTGWELRPEGAGSARKRNWKVATTWSWSSWQGWEMQQFPCSTSSVSCYLGARKAAMGY